MEVAVEQNVVAAANPIGEGLRIAAAAAKSCPQEIGHGDGRRVAPVGGEAECGGVHVVSLVVAIGLGRNVAGDQQEEQREQRSKHKDMPRPLGGWRAVTGSERPKPIAERFRSAGLLNYRITC